MKGDSVAIRGVTRVGLVVLPSGRRLQIRSKIPALALLQWLAYLGEFQHLTAWLSEPGVSTGRDLPQCLAQLYLIALEHVTQRHVRKDYVALRTQQPSIRGRVIMPALARSIHHLPRIPQIRRARSLDTPFNRVLAMALDRTRILLRDASDDDRRRLSRLCEEWAAISRTEADTTAAIIAAQWSNPAGYREALQLARLLLTGAAIDPDSGVGGEAFTLSLAALWERALRRMFDEISVSTGWRRVSDEKRTRRWDDSVGEEDTQRRLMADVIVERNGRRWVLDAKYKRDFGDEGRHDRFQMCAYAVAFDADRVSLVYPVTTSGVKFHNLLVTSIGGKRIQIDSLSLPMAAGPEACRAALQSLAVETDDAR